MGKECKCENGRGKFAEIVSTVNCPIHNNTSLNKDEEWYIKEFRGLDFSKFESEKDIMKFTMLHHENLEAFLHKVAHKVRNATEKEVIEKLLKLVPEEELDKIMYLSNDVREFAKQLREHLLASLTKEV